MIMAMMVLVKALRTTPLTTIMTDVVREECGKEGSTRTYLAYHVIAPYLVNLI